MLRMRLVVVAAILLAGCAKTADRIPASYVSPLTYQNYDCAQITAESQRVSAQVAELTGQQNQNAKNDAIATGVAVVIFWPAAFFIHGNDQAGQLGQLKGEMDALQQAAISKKCGIEFRTAPSKG